MTRAVIYARYSSALQSEASIEDQVRLCQERIEREGWQLTQTYADRAMSGSTLLRPGIQSLIQDAMAGHFDLVLAEALDRISRDQADVAALYKRMRFLGIPIVTLTEGEVSDLHVGLKGTMNALYLRDLADKTRRGLRGRVEAGFSGGGNSYGYAAPSGTGKETEAGQRVIVEAEADVVRRIFTEYAHGASPRRIAFGLNHDRIPGPRGKAWGASTINGNAARGTGILNNELYIGRLVWNRLRYIKDPDTGKRVSRLNPREEWIVKEVPDLRIVPQELWDRVKDRQNSASRETRPDSRQPRPFWDRRRPRYLLSGLIKCGVCGGGYTTISANLFGCATARNKGTCDNRLNIRRDDLEAAILEGLKHHLMDPGLFKTFVQEFHKELNRLRLQESARFDEAQAELTRTKDRIRKIVDAIAEGVPALSLKDELLALEARQRDLEAELAAGPENAKPLIHPNLAEVYRQKVADLQAALYDEATKDEAFDLIRTLIEAVVLTPENGALRVNLRGDLAAILTLCADSKKPATISRDGLEQIKVVAGARNRLSRNFEDRFESKDSHHLCCISDGFTYPTIDR